MVCPVVSAHYPRRGILKGGCIFFLGLFLFFFGLCFDFFLLSLSIIWRLWLLWLPWLFGFYNFQGASVAFGVSGLYGFLVSVVFWLLCFLYLL